MFEVYEDVNFFLTVVRMLFQTTSTYVNQYDFIYLKNV